MPTIFEGLTVVELGTGVACGLPAMVLADNGARVIKVEPPTGDPLRSAMPTAFLVWNRGKESLALDLATPYAQLRAAELVSNADVVIEAFGPGVASRLGLDASEMLKRNSALVYCSIKGFGSTGPYAHIKAYEGVIAAKAGGYPTASFRAGPAFFGMPRASVAAGHHALQGIVAALVARESTGRGQIVEADLFMGLTTYDYFGMAVYQLTQRNSTNHGNRSATILGGHLCSADGRWVLPTNRLRKELEALVRAVELDDVWDQPRFKLHGEHGEVPRTASPDDDRSLWDLIRDRFRSRPLAEWLPLMNKEDDLAAEWMRTCEEGLDHPQVIHNDHVVELDDPRVGRMRQVGPIALFSQTPSVIRAPAPSLDDHKPLEHASFSGLPVPTGNAWPEHPLSGITIIEVGHHFAMPYAITLVAALGARVIKVEPPQGDHMRDLVPIPEAAGHKVMDGKESIIADVRTAEGQEIVYELARRADVFALGLRQPAADRMRMNEDVIRSVNPDIVYFSATGYGDSGPFVGKAMHAGTASVAIGSAHHQAPTWLDPRRASGAGPDELDQLGARFGSGANNGDAASAASAASALVLGIFAKRRLGIGQYVRTTMLIGNAYSYSDDFNSYDGKPQSPLPDPDQLGLSPLYRLYPTASGWVFFAAPSADDWRDFCQVAAPELADDPRFSTVEDRATNEAALASALTNLFAQRSAGEWEATLARRGVGCVEVYEGSASQFACTDPDIRSTGHVVEVDHPIFGPILRAGLPQRFSETPGRLGTGCWAGQHTRSVLEELGYSNERIATLEAKGITATRRGQHSEPASPRA
jgi:crotonobetainyl-CoA:carnitine CoA-transferase CaiB-like acyl-CoA transferase